MSLRIVQTTFGVFHHFDLARQLESRGLLTHIFSTWPHARLRREGIPRVKVSTFPWIHTLEYAMRRYKLLPDWLENQMGYANALAFDEYTQQHLQPCDVLIALSGSSLKTGRQLQSEGGIFICDRSSSHQRYQEQIVLEEHRKWRVPLPPNDPRDTVREEAIYSQADAIVVPSSFAARSFVDMGIPATKVHIISLGVQLDKFSPISEPPVDCFEVLFVGGVSLRKGIHYLLIAFSNVKCRRKRLRIAGGVSKELIRFLARFPMTDVEVLGAVAQDSLSKIMSTSHVLVLPSVEDGFGMVLGQALASGCPIIATTNTGGPDLIRDGSEGFLVPIRDSEALTDRMQRLVDSPVLRTSMRLAGLARVANLGGWNNYGDEWERLLFKLTAPKQYAKSNVSNDLAG